jgi:hypothetical protein
MDAARRSCSAVKIQAEKERARPDSGGNRRPAEQLIHDRQFDTLKNIAASLLDQRCITFVFMRQRSIHQE